MTMNTEFSTQDLGLATALAALEFELIALDRTDPRRVRFIFRRQPGLQDIIAGFWDDSLTLPAQKLLLAQKQLKNRLYQETERL